MNYDFNADMREVAKRLAKKPEQPEKSIVPIDGFIRMECGCSIDVTRHTGNECRHRRDPFEQDDVKETIFWREQNGF